GLLPSHRGRGGWAWLWCCCLPLLVARDPRRAEERVVRGQRAVRLPVVRLVDGRRRRRLSAREEPLPPLRPACVEVAVGREQVHVACSFEKRVETRGPFVARD